MNNTMRTLVILGGLTALVAQSSAAITITPLDASVTAAGNEASLLPMQLSNGVTGVGPVVDSGAFLVTTDGGLTELQVGEVSGLTDNGNLQLTVLLDGSTILYQDQTVSDNPLIQYNDNIFGSPLLGTHLVQYFATYTGNAADSQGYLGGFTVDAYEAVPEPAPLAAMGIGIIGILARRRRSGK